MRYLCLTLSVLIVLSGLWLALLADPAAAPPPTVDTPERVPDGQPVTGIATDPAGGDVTVTATLMPDGTPLGTDIEMEGLQNQFSFDVPPGSSGKWVLIVAENEDGTRTTARVDID